MISMNIKVLAGVAVLALGASTVNAAVVYELSTGPGNNYYQGLKEFGDELHLAGTERIIESFSFDYSANYTQAGALTFNIYANDGAIVSGNRVPGTLLDTRVLDVTSGGGHIQINYPYDPANVLPDTITYTVAFAGIGGGSPNRAGLILPGGSPAVGTSFDDIWQRTGPGASDWALIQVTDQNGASVIANFKATVTAVPEPGTIALLALGGLGILVASRRRA